MTDAVVFFKKVLNLLIGLVEPAYRTPLFVLVQKAVGQQLTDLKLLNIRH
jgi:hypothetical protein